MALTARAISGTGRTNGGLENGVGDKIRQNRNMKKKSMKHSVVGEML